MSIPELITNYFNPAETWVQVEDTIFKVNQSILSPSPLMHDILQIDNSNTNGGGHDPTTMANPLPLPQVTKDQFISFIQFMKTYPMLRLNITRSFQFSTYVQAALVCHRLQMDDYFNLAFSFVTEVHYREEYPCNLDHRFDMREDVLDLDTYPWMEMFQLATRIGGERLTMSLIEALKKWIDEPCDSDECDQRWLTAWDIVSKSESAPAQTHCAYQMILQDIHKNVTDLVTQTRLLEAEKVLDKYNKWLFQYMVVSDGSPFAWIGPGNESLDHVVDDLLSKKCPSMLRTKFWSNWYKHASVKHSMAFIPNTNRAEMVTDFIMLCPDVQEAIQDSVVCTTEECVCNAKRMLSQAFGNLMDNFHKEFNRAVLGPVTKDGVEIDPIRQPVGVDTRFVVQMQVQVQGCGHMSYAKRR